ncbi:hypothetical protein [Streptomyces acidiscabies]|uniref:hypothetical protein n=1 Tax=Streptomyces acidiscabies TaxID=42234 RepID=UPI0038F5FD00
MDEGDADVAVAGIPERLPEGLAGGTVTRTELVFVTTRAKDAERGHAEGERPEPAQPHEGLLTLVALGCGTGIVPRLVLEHSAVRDRLTVVPVTPRPEPLAAGLRGRRADLRRPVVALWSLTALN